jgi:hypothetical protein
MTHCAEDQPSLFDETPRVELKPAQRSELAAALEALLREIAAALASPRDGENGHEQDHR